MAPRDSRNIDVGIHSLISQKIPFVMDTASIFFHLKNHLPQILQLPLAANMQNIWSEVAAHVT